MKDIKFTITYCALIALLTLTFPYSAYVKTISICAIGLYYVISQPTNKLTGRSAYVWLYILFALWATISSQWAIYPEAVSEHILNVYLAIMINVLMVMYLTINRENLDSVYKWLMPVLLIYIVQSILVGHFDNGSRFSATGAVNQFGMSMSYIFLFALYAIKEKKKRSAMMYLILTASCVLSFMSGSRKALLNILIFTCIIFLFSKYDKDFIKNVGRLIIVGVIVAVLIIAVLNIDALYEVLGKRLESLFAYFSGDVEQDYSALRRNYMREDAFQIFLSNPIKGIGMNNFKYVARYGTYSHTNYLEMLSCLGIIGTLLYYVPVVIVMIKSFIHWKNNYKDAVIPFAVLLSIFISDYGNVSYIYSIIHIFAGIAAGLVFVNEIEHKEALEAIEEDVTDNEDDNKQIQENPT